MSIRQYVCMEDETFCFYDNFYFIFIYISRQLTDCVAYIQNVLFFFNLCILQTRIISTYYNKIF